MSKKTLPNQSDNQLINAYLKGDNASLEILIKRYLGPIYSFICRYVGSATEAEDLTQEVFVKMWKNLKKFDPRIISLGRNRRGRQQRSPAPYRTEGSGSGFKTWIFSIAKNASIDFLREKKTLPFSAFEDDEGENLLLNSLADPAPLPGEILERKDLTGRLSLALEKLAPKYRLTLYLRYNDHFTFREIAETLEESLNTVKGRHRRALITLKGLLAESF